VRVRFFAASRNCIDASFVVLGRKPGKPIFSARSLLEKLVLRFLSWANFVAE